MFQIGEFSFLLARVGLATNSISQDLYSLVLVTAVTTMIFTPLAAQAVEPIYRFYRKRKGVQEAHYSVNLPEEGLHNHVVIAGAGRVGQYIAGVLQRLNLSFVSIELDHQRVEECKAQGIPVIYGDASQPVVLEAAGITEAHLLLITTPTIGVTESIALHVRRLCPDLHIVARAEGKDQMTTLHDMGVYEVVQPEFEAGLEITRQALLHLEVPTSDIQRFTDAVRRELYAPLYTLHGNYQTIAELQDAQKLLELNWITLAVPSPLVGQTIREAHIRSRTGVSVVAILRNGVLIANPEIDQSLTTNDRIAVLGDHQQLARFKELVLAGHTAAEAGLMGVDTLNHRRHR
jgi:monovalent cation:H+ antiporter-2, CPA2 family